MNVKAIFITLIFVKLAVITAVSSPLPYQAKDKHLGVSSCASSVCHGAVRPNESYDIGLNEYIIWAHHDLHARAYQTLLTDDSKAIAKKLGLTDAHSAEICLDCHSDHVPEEKRGKNFQLSDGVGCEACHGGAEKWIEGHASKDVSYQKNVDHGMYPTVDMDKRNTLCLSCHYGNNDKFATHRIMGAGHPRLSFELDTFLALQPPHYELDDDYKKRKTVHDRTKQWALGQIAAARSQLEMLQGPFIQKRQLFPELALFDCYACHNNSTHQLNWRRRTNTIRSEPGSVPVNDGHLRMVVVIAKQVDEHAAKQILVLCQSLQQAVSATPRKVANVSRQLGHMINRIGDALGAAVYSESDKMQILVNLIDMGIKGDYRDYIGAEQATMAIELISIDIKKADKYRSHLDKLYGLLKKDEGYRPTQFAKALSLLKADL